MQGLAFDQYRNQFIGKSVEWEGSVYGTQSHEGQCWVLICAMCEGGEKRVFDTFVTIPCSQAESFKSGNIVKARGRIKEVLDSEKGVFDYYRTGFKVHLE